MPDPTPAGTGAGERANPGDPWPPLDEDEPTLCHAQRDGDCSWKWCPQLREYHGHCPLDRIPESAVAADARPADVHALAHALRYLPGVELHNDPAVIAADLLARVALPAADARRTDWRAAGTFDYAAFQRELDELAAELAADARPEAGEPSERVLRKLLWLSHGHERLYGDDGEMQCVECPLDFKRATVAEIEAVFFTPRLRAATPPGSASGTREEDGRVRERAACIADVARLRDAAVSPATHQALSLAVNELRRRGGPTDG